MFLLTNSLMELVYRFDLIAFIVVLLIVLIVLRMAGRDREHFVKN